MDKTVPSFRIVLAMEKEEWNKPFRNALDRSGRKKFDDKEEMMFDVSRLYVATCSYVIQSVRLYPILLMSILLYYCYKQLIEYTKQVEQIMAAIEIGEEEEKEDHHHNEPVSN
jgi:hypothetical protein